MKSEVKSNGISQTRSNEVLAAQLALEKDKKERAELCGPEVKEILKKYQCIMQPVTQIVDNKIIQYVQIVAE